MSVHFFTCTKQKIVKSASWNHLGNLLLSQSWLSFHTWFFFHYNLVYFDFVRTSNSPKSCVWYHCIKFLFERVWWEFCLILFSVILSTPGKHMYCMQLSADHQGDCFTSCTEQRYFRSSQTDLVTFPYLPWYWPWVHINENVQPEGVKLSPLCPEKIGFWLL